MPEQEVVVQSIDPRFAGQQYQQQQQARGSLNALSIGLLDIFGFEIFEKNYFEQLCINYANEKLQQHFMQYVLKDEEAVYTREEIDFIPVNFMDNTDVLDLFEESPQGILSLLDEEIVIPRGSDQGFLNKLIKAREGHARFFVNVRMARTEFGIRHYAGSVVYDSTSMLTKNKDKLHAHLVKLLSKGGNSLLRLLYPESEVMTNEQEKNGSSSGSASKGRKSRRGGKRKTIASMTLGTQFECQLSDLLENRLKKASPHFIRCIKPNGSKAPDMFEGFLVMEQLRYSGVLEAIQFVSCHRSSGS